MSREPTRDNAAIHPRMSPAALGAAALLIVLAMALLWAGSRGPEPRAAGPEAQRADGPEGQPAPRATAGRTRGAERADGLERQFDLSDLTIPREQILPGGPGKDGIPALTTEAARDGRRRDPAVHGRHPPVIAPAAEADTPRRHDRIVGLTIGGESRAYPINVLNWHEVVNDVLGGVPIAVIYCPLCDSVSVVDRRVEGEEYEFGVSGLLHNSNVLMYDRTHDALWSQVKLAAVSGPNAGRSLDHLGGWRIGSFGAWLADHPDGTVLTHRTGFQRNYERNPYEGYFGTDRLHFPTSRSDDRLPPKEPIIGVRMGDITRAYPLSEVHRAGTLRDTIGDGRIVLESVGDGSGVEIAEAPEEAHVIHTFWFTWAAFWPDTEIHRPADRE